MNNTLYNPQLEHDACGIGFVANLKNQSSPKIIQDALLMLQNMVHRGGIGDEPNSGDGAGLLIQLPHKFLKYKMASQNIDLPAVGSYGVGCLFLPKAIDREREVWAMLEKQATYLNLKLLGRRRLPVYNGDLGKRAISKEPRMYHVFFTTQRSYLPAALERQLYILKAITTKAATYDLDLPDFYWASLSSKTLVYKGQLVVDQVQDYFLDLKEDALESAFAIVHSRFSTNTFPNWKLAQPFRYIAHNGEINTIRGNINWMRTRESLLETSHFSPTEIEWLMPLCDHRASDSANLDTVIEMMVLGGIPLAQVLMMLIPEAWQNNTLMDPAKKACYEYFASVMEPWDGPAAICFTDGNLIGATLDRSGLRPFRYCLTSDNYLIAASEAGVLPIDQSKVLKKGCLQPGKILIANLEQGRIISDNEIKTSIYKKQPYQNWLNEYKISLAKLPYLQYSPLDLEPKTLFIKQQTFGYTREDLKLILTGMMNTGKEPIGSMGADTPLAVLSQKPLHFSHYFKQLFAQVSNPPIDPIRERLIMSLYMILGASKNILVESPQHCEHIALEHPILTDKDLAKIQSIADKPFKITTIKVLFKTAYKPGNLEQTIDFINSTACESVRKGSNILIISDKDNNGQLAPIPSLLAVSSIHQVLVREKLRSSTSLIVETGDAWETHHFATLIGYGANAVNPYLAFQSLRQLYHDNSFEDSWNSFDNIMDRYIEAINYGLLKILAKMGISTLQSYHGAQIFEILGLENKVIEKCFPHSISRIDGLTFDDIARESLQKVKRAYSERNFSSPTLMTGGLYQWRRTGEYHAYNPKTIHFLQQSTKTNNYTMYKEFAQLVNQQSELSCNLRGLLDFQISKSIPLSQVEPKSNIIRRFATGAMSFGSLSFEAHTTLAIAMNRIGGKSNSGEGGEDDIRYKPLENGDSSSSAIKQIASGRFGVTSYYLNNACELQIKMAQGAKPGEGGQLPGHKVDSWIAKVRYSMPGVELISPPPHHDIYSIEDLQQLIFDLKNANPRARINVKLVAEAGVGTIAAGVVKARADTIMISGHDGGTGASPLSSIRHAGLPWELGLAETHQTLVLNNLRSRVVLQTDGQIKTGRDLAVAILLGAEEFGVATAALVVEGCILMRKCHLNTCPVGIATQNPELRKLFTGKADHVVNFFHFLAQDLRETMAQLGFKTVDEMVGQADRLKVKPQFPAKSKVQSLNLEPILYKIPHKGTGLYKQYSQDHGITDVLDKQIIKVAQPALESKNPIQASFKIKNTDRTTGAMLSSRVSRLYGKEGLVEDTLKINFRGTGGQSFGAFLAPGITFNLEGEANDYFAKGLSGGKISIRPDRLNNFLPHDNQIIGNVAFYGATSGKAFINGLAGERFCVRNSGAEVVVEGIGDHGCEYMTGGKVIILGKVGRNFGAGMSGGMAYIWDLTGLFKKFCSEPSLDFDPLTFEDLTLVKQFIDEHFDYTNSAVAKYLLQDWDNQKQIFTKVIPREYKKILEQELQDVS